MCREYTSSSSITPTECLKTFIHLQHILTKSNHTFSGKLLSTGIYWIKFDREIFVVFIRNWRSSLSMFVKCMPLLWSELCASIAYANLHCTLQATRSECTALSIIRKPVAAIHRSPAFFTLAPAFCLRLWARIATDLRQPGFRTALLILANGVLSTQMVLITARLGANLVVQVPALYQRKQK